MTSCTILILLDTQNTWQDICQESHLVVLGGIAPRPQLESCIYVIVISHKMKKIIIIRAEVARAAFRARFSKSKTEEMSDPTPSVLRDTSMGRDGCRGRAFTCVCVCVCVYEGGRGGEGRGGEE